jgi:hypothetical protein
MIDLVRGAGLVELVGGCKLTIDRTMRVTDFYSKTEIDDLLASYVQLNLTSEEDTGDTSGTENVLVKFGPAIGPRFALVASVSNATDAN